MTKIYKVHDLCMEIMMSDEMARNSDKYLYLKVCQRINEQILAEPLKTVLTEFKKYGVPCFESVGRARRKIQAQFPELRACAEVSDRRLENELIMEQYAKEKF